MKITLLIHNEAHPDHPMGMIATEVEHLARILTFQSEEKNMSVEGVITIQPEEENTDDTETN